MFEFFSHPLIDNYSYEGLNIVILFNPGSNFE